ncbi:Beta-glucanase, GH16 family [Rubritalea squalenifaciens DSM 18772]|uniref:Beta-glucanase, GH16 family n=1 Tax=Rubritalea squalenifaciens DSM 18772 TaxID=1123071 RepID=A0A1M6JG77_9BACT|nr:glycoside hydrolase family 16 protein [Rubritalea squalenifaciens]SHJ45690.1 Beta-glucanase, GH16 family [Rubritalea squalenifaciens DSM 18772]
MRFYTLLLSTLMIGGSFASAAEKVTVPEGWKLHWQEEFNGPLNEKVWSRVTKGTADWSNMMTDHPKAVRVQSGVLRLWGVKNTKKGEQPYLTGGLSSNGKFDFEYGKVQIRARFKSAKGAWPALWMLKSNAKWGKEGMGEIDIMEHLNFEDQVYQTVHSYYTVHKGGSNKPPKSGTAKISRDDWNTYGVEWDKEKIVFTVNGKPTHSYAKQADKGAEQYPFHGPFYFILSMQIEGKWVGEADPKDYPAWMDVDWVRVYKKAE